MQEAVSMHKRIKHRQWISVVFSLFLFYSMEVGGGGWALPLVVFL